MSPPILPRFAHLARTWSIESQQRSRRNAMLAATECAQRRAERQEVHDFLASQAAPVVEAVAPDVRVAER